MLARPAHPGRAPRRRADRAAAGTELGCACGESDCAAGQPAATPATTAVVHVVADAETVEAATPAAQSPPRRPPGRPSVRRRRRSRWAPGLPAPLLAATLQRATLRTIRHPGQAPPQPRYAPSRTLAEFVRCRDLTCRFPGCDRPATHCDIDHTVAYPVGPTHASNPEMLMPPAPLPHHALGRCGPVAGSPTPTRHYLECGLICGHEEMAVTWAPPRGVARDRCPGRRVVRNGKRPLSHGGMVARKCRRQMASRERPDGWRTL